MKEYSPDAPIRALLVEDDAESGEAVKTMLEKRGVSVGMARSAEDALDRFSPDKWDIAVADVRLGGMSGVDLLGRIRAQDPNFPVILLTGFDSLDTAIQAVRLGAQDYILKPLEDIEDLMGPVRKAVVNHRTLVDNQELEEELRQSEARVRAVLENSRDIAYRIDLKRKALDYISPSVWKILGRAGGAFAGLGLADVLDFVHPDDRELVNRCIAELKGAVCRGGHTSASVECRVRHTRGHYVWLSVVHAVELSADTRRPVAIVGNARDIEERKTAEAREKAFQTKMARVERMESLSVLAGGVAHDLNNILCSVSIRPRLLLEQLQKDGSIADCDEVRDALTVVSDAALRAGEVVKDLLTLSRRGNYKFKPVDLNRVIRRYMQSPAFLSISDANPETTVRQALECGSLSVSGSESHLDQVVMNLVTNAFEAMKAGGSLQVKTSRVCVATELQAYEVIAPGEYVLLQVADSGDGIAEDAMHRIFEPFYSRKKMGNRSGTGLGLSVVHGVTKDHGGFIDVRTELNVGTVFDIYFPVCGEPVEIPCGKSLKSLSGSGDILVVDDEAEQRELGRRALSRLGYRVATASNGREAVDLCRQRVSGGAGPEAQHPFDLVMLDMLLDDGFDGLDAYREIVELCPGQKCVIVSGFAKNERVAGARALGARTFVSKPYNVETLASAVRDELGDRTV